MLVFVVSRLAGKHVAAWIIGKREPEMLGAPERRVLAFAPIGAFAIAIVITARDLYPSARVPWMLTAGIGGAIFSEIILQAAKRKWPVAE
jgi:hypothetical protein